MSRIYYMKMTLYFFQLVAGVACYALLHTPTETWAFFRFFSRAHTLKTKEFKKQFEFKENFLSWGDDGVKWEIFDRSTSLAFVFQLLIQVSFCFWMVTFLKLITRFPQCYVAEAEGKPTRCNFENVFHVGAVALYIFISAFALARINGPSLPYLKDTKNATIATIFGLIAGVLHMIFLFVLEKEYRQRAKESSHPQAIPFNAMHEVSHTARLE